MREKLDPCTCLVGGVRRPFARKPSPTAPKGYFDHFPFLHTTPQGTKHKFSHFTSPLSSQPSGLHQNDTPAVNNRRRPSRARCWATLVALPEGSPLSEAMSLRYQQIHFFFNRSHPHQQDRQSIPKGYRAQLRMDFSIVIQKLDPLEDFV